MTQIVSQPAEAKTPLFDAVPPMQMARPVIEVINCYEVRVLWEPLTKRTKNWSWSRTRAGSEHVDADAEGLRIRYREDGGTNIVLSDTFQPEEHQALLTCLTPGRNYIVEVGAFNRAGDGPWSNPSDLFKVPEDGFTLSPPSKMARPTVKPLNSYAVLVLWTPPADLAGFRRPVKPLALPPSRGGPARSEAVRTLSASAKLPPACAERPAMVKGVRLRYREPGQLPVTVNTEWEPEASEAVLKCLEGGKSYFFEVCAFNDAGGGDWSDPSEPFLMAMGAAPDDTSVERPTCISHEADSIEISWKKPCDRGAPIMLYEVQCSLDKNFEEGATTKTMEVNGERTCCVVKSLEPNTTYYLRHRAINKIGTSKWSLATPGIATAAKPPEPPAAPERLGAQDSSNKPFEVSLKWNVPFSSGIPIQNYRVRMATNPEMEGALEIPIGERPNVSGERPTTAGGGQESKAIAAMPLGDAEEDLGSLGGGAGGSVSCLSTPKAMGSPTTRRPGFAKGAYALTQLRVIGLRPVTSYYFQVMAVNQIAESAWSAASAPMKTAMAAPARCGQIRLIAAGCQRDGFVVRWSVPESFGVPVATYEVRTARHVNMDGAKVLTCSMKALPAADGGLGEMEATFKDCNGPGQDNFYQVRAKNAAGIGDWSPVSLAMQVIPEKPPAPEPPSNFTSLPRAIVVQWEPVHCVAAPIVGYRLRYDVRKDMSKPVEVMGLRGLETCFTVTSLVPHHNYHFQIAAVNAVGSSHWSECSRPVQVLQEAPVKMSAPELVELQQRAVVIKFMPPVDCGTHDGELIQSYTVRYSTSLDALLNLARRERHSAPPKGSSATKSSDGVGVASADDPVMTTVPGDDGAPVHVIRNAHRAHTTCGELLPGTLAHFHVFAINEFGEGLPSDIVEFTTLPGPPEQPGAPIIVEVTPWSIVVGVLSDIVDNGKPISHFTFQVEDALSPGVTLRELGPFAAEKNPEDPCCQYTVNNLEPGNSYRFVVCAFNACGVSSWSELSETATTEPTAPGKIELMGARASEITDCSFRAHWDTPITNGMPIQSYTVMHSSKDGPVEIKTTETTALCENLTAGTVSTFKIAAHNAAGSSAFSTPVEVRTLPGIPRAPMRPWCREIAATSLTIKWNAPYDSGEKITRFWLHYEEIGDDGRSKAGDDGDRGEIVLEGTRTHCDVRCLKASHSYIFKLAAENVLGCGPYGPPSEAARMQAAAVPNAPGLPVFTKATLHNIFCKWQESSSDGADVLEQVARISKHRDMPEGTYTEIKFPPNPPQRNAPEDLAPVIKTLKVKGGGATKKYRMKLSNNDRPYIKGMCFSYKGDSQSRAAAGESQEGERLLTVHAGQYGAIGEVAVREKTGTSDDVLSSGSTIVPSGPETSPATPSGTQLLMMDSREPDWSEHEFSGLEPGTEYWVRVACRSSAGMSEWAVAREPFLTSFATPQDIAEVKFVEKDYQSLMLQWSVPDMMGSPILEYRVRLAPTEEALANDSCPETIVKVEDLADQSRPRLKSSGLMHGAQYFAKVRSANRGGSSGWSKLVTEKTDPYFPAGMQAVEPVAGGQTTEGIIVSWKPVANRGAALERYELRYAAAAIEEPPVSLEDVMNGSVKIVERDAGGSLPTTCTLTALPRGHIVAVRIRVANRIGWGDWSSLAEGDRELASSGPASYRSFQVLPCEPSPPGPVSVMRDWITPYSAAFTFNLGERCNGELYEGYRFRLFRGEIGAGLESPFEDLPMRDWMSEASELERMDALKLKLRVERPLEELEPGTKYALSVCSRNKAGESNWSSLGAPFCTSAERPTLLYSIASDFQTPDSVQIKYRPGDANGAPILGYEMRFNVGLGESLPMDQWEVVNEATLEAKSLPHDMDPDARTYEVGGLPPAVTVWAMYRMRNRVGYSEWSDAEQFVTRATRPSLPKQLEVMKTASTELELKWAPAETHGAPVTRYDFLAGPDVKLLRWARLACDLLWIRISSEQVFGVHKFVDDSIPPEGIDTDKMAAYDCDTVLFMHLPAENTTYSMDRLLPGRKYYFMVRGCSAAGKSNWSFVKETPFTLATLPEQPEAFRLETLSGHDCTLTFRLPHHNGAPIKDAKVVLARVRGPLAQDEMDPLTKQPLPHLLGREMVIHPLGQPLFNEDGFDSPEAKKAAEEDARRNWALSFELNYPRRTIQLSNLMAGSAYTVRWSVRNEIGSSDFSYYTHFETQAGLPDEPTEIIVPGG
eukprot:TRINITY_DN26925_c0_g1_i1.p1 TRINITY_DN26925_c0_g1~~TRINITY_DN26925_c0_g1_i1.p1  ORF type:complete len:2215 (+),score=474.36 TRINITY_DN26925_c0_g1_i1:277-6921(+)